MVSFRDVLDAAMLNLDAAPSPGSLEATLRQAETQLLDADAGARMGAPLVLLLGGDAPRTLQDVKRAFRERALSTHPDRPGGSHEAFLETMAMYEAACLELAS